MLWVRLRAVGMGPKDAEVSGRIDSQRRGGGGVLRWAKSPGGWRASTSARALRALRIFSRVGFMNSGGTSGSESSGSSWRNTVRALKAGAGAMQREAGIPAVTVNVVEHHHHAHCWRRPSRGGSGSRCASEEGSHSSFSLMMTSWWWAADFSRAVRVASRYAGRDRRDGTERAG